MEPIDTSITKINENLRVVTTKKNKGVIKLRYAPNQPKPEKINTTWDLSNVSK